MTLEKQMSQIEHLEILNASLRLENENIRKELHNMKRMYIAKVEKLEKAINAELTRAELLQYDLDCMDDFINDVCDKYGLKYSRNPS